LLALILNLDENKFSAKADRSQKEEFGFDQNIRRRHDTEMQLKISSKLTTRNQIEFTARNQIEFTARNQINQLNQICLIDIANPTFFECILKMLNMIKTAPEEYEYLVTPDLCDSYISNNIS